MVLLLGWLSRRNCTVPQELSTAGETLLANMSLLFVPVGVGVMNHWELLYKNGIAIVAALILSTLASMAVTAWVAHRLADVRIKPISAVAAWLARRGASALRIARSTPPKALLRMLRSK
jgi:putative effector of murein hydrolase LrgA (UPF0299 family)